MMNSLCLSHEELVEVTGLKKFSAQVRWLRREGFVVKQRSDGTPLVARAHFLNMMGLSNENFHREQQPDFSSLL